MKKIYVYQCGICNERKTTTTFNKQYCGSQRDVGSCSYINTKHKREENRQKKMRERMDLDMSDEYMSLKERRSLGGINI